MKVFMSNSSKIINISERLKRSSMRTQATQTDRAKNNGNGNGGPGAGLLPGQLNHILGLQKVGD